MPETRETPKIERAVLCTYYICSIVIESSEGEVKDYDCDLLYFVDKVFMISSYEDDKGSELVFAASL
jgi:hypothetical protein